jgi:hypothetical protein
MRRIGFYISDFASDSEGFVVSDLDELVGRGVITVPEHVWPKRRAEVVPPDKRRTPSEARHLRLVACYAPSTPAARS